MTEQNKLDLVEFIKNKQKQEEAKRPEKLYSQMTKNVYIAYVWFFLTGWLFAGQRLYLKQSNACWVYFGALMLSHLWQPFAYICLIMFFFDAFALPQLVRDYNDKVIKEKLTNKKEEKKTFNIKEWFIGLYHNHTKTTVATIVVIAFWIFLGFKY